jgi:hypothetical protein
LALALRSWAFCGHEHFAVLGTVGGSKDLAEIDCPLALLPQLADDDNPAREHSRSR